jgi:hypothetical protein
MKLIMFLIVAFAAFTLIDFNCRGIVVASKESRQKNLIALTKKTLREIEKFTIINSRPPKTLAEVGISYLKQDHELILSNNEGSPWILYSQDPVNNDIYIAGALPDKVVLIKKSELECSFDK